MENIIRNFSDIIQEYYIEPEIQGYNKLIQQARIAFIDTSKLVIRDIIIFLDDDSVRRKYSYQWMTNENELIIRWDNAPHHKELESFPHHKHVEIEKNVELSQEMTIQGVLLQIKEMIQNKKD